MNQRRRLAIIAALAVVATSTALVPIFDDPGWLGYVITVIAALTATQIGLRALRSPTWVHPFAGLVVLTFYMTVVFASDSAWFGVIPNSETFRAFGSQFSDGMNDIASLSAPVALRRGLMLMTTLGIGLIAIVVDFLAVTLRKAALAGLPLLAVYAVPVAIDRDGLVWWTFTLGAAAYLWLLIADQSDRVRRWGRPFRSRSDIEATTAPASQFSATGRWVGAVGVVAAIIIPVFLPTLTPTDWMGIGGNGLLGDGNGRSVQTINPITELKGRLTQREEVELLQVRTDDPDPFYLRLTTLDKFTGNGWTQSTLRATADNRVSNNPYTPAAGLTLGQEQHTSVNITNFDRSSYLPVYSNPTDVNVPGDWRWDARAETVFSAATKTEGLKYNFASTRPIFNSKDLSEAAALDSKEKIVVDYTDLGGEINRYAQNLLRDTILPGTETQFEKVLAINDYFSGNGFEYTLATDPGSSGSALEDFLRNKKGYCEQYASAMAYLVRAAEIPARVVIGFAQGEKKGDYYSVTNRDAHAWVEVYFEGSGWVPFDPTPSSALTDGRADSLPWAQEYTEDPSVVLPPGSGGPSRPNPTPSASRSADNRNDRNDLATATAGQSGGPFNIDIPDWLKPMTGPAAILLDDRELPRPPIWAQWLLGLMALVVLAVVPWFWRTRIRRARLRLVRSNDRLTSAHSAWDEFTDTLTDYGRTVDEAHTPRVIAGMLIDDLDVDDPARDAAKRLATAEEQARYAPRPGAFEDLGESVRIVSAAVRAKARRGQRIRATLLPASVTARAGQTARSLGDGMSALMADAGHMVLRIVSVGRWRPVE